MDLMHVLLALQKGKTRATYTAVAERLNTSPRSVMKGQPHTPLHSWVVNKRTKMPTGYSEENRHVDLLANSRVIQSGDELDTYLENH